MQGQQFLHRFQFNYHFVFYNQIRNHVTHGLTLIFHVKALLSLISNPALFEFYTKRVFVDAFKQTSAQFSMYGDGRPIYSICQFIMLECTSGPTIS